MLPRSSHSKHDSRRGPSHQVRYLVSFCDLDELGLQLRREAAQVGWDDAEQQIGGSGLEPFMHPSFPLVHLQALYYSEPDLPPLAMKPPRLSRKSTFPTHLDKIFASIPLRNDHLPRYHWQPYV